MGNLNLLIIFIKKYSMDPSKKPLTFGDFLGKKVNDFPTKKVEKYLD